MRRRLHLDGTLISYNDCAIAIFDNDAIDASRYNAFDTPNACSFFASIKGDLIDGGVDASAIEASNFVDATNSEAFRIHNVGAINANYCNLEASNDDTIYAYNSGALVDDGTSF